MSAPRSAYSSIELSLAAGYQWDFIRRRQGYVALATTINLLNTTGSITGIGSINGISGTRKASGSRPCSPASSWRHEPMQYPIHSAGFPSMAASRATGIFFDTVTSLYARGKANLRAPPSSEFNRRLSVGYPAQNKAANDRFGLRLTQTGPVVGLEASF